MMTKSFREAASRTNVRKTPNSSPSRSKKKQKLPLHLCHTLAAFWLLVVSRFWFLLLTRYERELKGGASVSLEPLAAASVVHICSISSRAHDLIRTLSLSPCCEASLPLPPRTKFLTALHGCRSASLTCSVRLSARGEASVSASG